MDVEDHIKSGLRALYAAAQARIDEQEARCIAIAGQIGSLTTQLVALERDLDGARSVMYQCAKLGGNVGVYFDTERHGVENPHKAAYLSVVPRHPANEPSH